ncbi:MAG: TonB-dependent receptor [Bacteroidota bacterium]
MSTPSFLSAFALALLMVPTSFAQTGTVSGRVTDAGTGDLLPGASIRVEGTQLGAATDAFGKFNVRSVPAGAVTLVASFVGYETARVEATALAGENVYVEVALAPDPGQIGEVVIRSEKFIRNLQETQASVGVVTSTEIEAIPVRDWEDAARLVGNVSTSGNGTFNIRGISNVGFGGGSPTATLYVDNVPQGLFTTSRTARGSWDLESVEVFRGPQSTLSGRNALAGAIYLRSAAPSFEYGAAARVRGGTQDALEGALMVTGPIVADQLAFRVSAESGTQDGDIDFLNVTSDDDGFARTNTIAQRNVRSRLLFTPTAVPGLSVLASHTLSYDRPPSFQGLTDLDARTNDGAVASFTETTLNNLSLEASYDLAPSLAITSITGAAISDYRIDGLTYQDPNGNPGIQQRAETDEFNFTQELRLNYETDQTRAVFGGYYGQFEYERTRSDEGDVFFTADADVLLPRLLPQLVPAPLLAFLPDNLEIQPYRIDAIDEGLDSDETRNLAVFGEVNHEVIDNLTLTAGFRYDNESLDVLTGQINTPTVEFRGVTAGQQIAALIPSGIPGVPPGAVIAAGIDEGVRQFAVETLTTSDSLSTNYEAFLPKIGLVYDLTPDASLGFTVQRGYRAGGAESFGVDSLNVFEPEYTWNYEVAARTRWLGGRVIANANVFYTDWTDQQVRVPIPGNAFFLTRTENAGASTLYGGELELRVVPTRGLTLYSSLGLTETEFDDFPTTITDQETGNDVSVNLAGLRFPGSPEQTLAAGLIYDVGEGPFAGINVSYTGENYTQVGNVLDADGTPQLDERLRAGDYTIVDGQVGYVFDLQGQRARVTAFARNLFDVTARDRVFLEPSGRSVFTIEPPRIVGLSLDVRL